MPISKRKLAANRANAQKSTGPTSPEGKGKVVLNAIQRTGRLRPVVRVKQRAGLCGRFRVLDDENQAEYDDLLKRFLEAEQPADHVERELVAKMARHTWLAERSIRFQEACFLFQPQTPDELANERQSVGVRVDLDVYVRYQAAHDRAYQRAANELARRRKERMLAERGFVVSQKRAAAEEKRREEQQTQRRELHSFKVAIAKARFAAINEPAGLSEAKIQGGRGRKKPKSRSASPPKSPKPPHKRRHRQSFLIVRDKSSLFVSARVLVETAGVESASVASCFSACRFSACRFSA